MNNAEQQLQKWMQGRENEHLEFKEAKNRYDFEELVKYCVAMANEGGGKIILGVTDKSPRKVIGTQAFDNLERTKAGLTDRIHMRIDAEEISHPDGRVLVFSVPSRPIGTPVHYPRNRRIADALARCGLVERAGQGANRIFEACIRESKPLPDFTHTDAWQVSLTLHGQVQDPQFVKFLERLGQETGSNFDTHDFLILDLVHRKRSIPATLRPRLERMLDLGCVECVGHGRGVSYLLSRRFYSAIGKGGEYTRRKGLDRETNKTLLLKHIRDMQPNGCPLNELSQVLPGVSQSYIQGLLRELRDEKRIVSKGERRWAKWHLGLEN